MALGHFSLWQLANFRCGTWPIFVVELGRFLLWNLANSCCGTWLFFFMVL